MEISNVVTGEQGLTGVIDRLISYKNIRVTWLAGFGYVGYSDGGFGEGFPTELAPGATRTGLLNCLNKAFKLHN